MTDKQRIRQLEQRLKKTEAVLARLIPLIRHNWCTLGGHMYKKLGQLERKYNG